MSTIATLNRFLQQLGLAVCLIEKELPLMREANPNLLV